MGVPLPIPRSSVANDFYRPALAPPPVVAPAPGISPPRVIPFVRLAPAPPRPRRDFSFAVALAAIFMAATISLLGAVGGMVLWFTYDTGVADAVPVAPPPIVKTAEAPPKNLSAPLQAAFLPPASNPVAADISLSAGSMTPPAPQVALNAAALDAAADAIGKANALQMTMRDAKQEDADTPDDAASLAKQAKMLGRQDRITEAIAALTRAARAEPDNVSYRLDLAVLYDRDGDAPKALVLYRQVLDAAQDGGLEDADASAAGLPSPQALAAIRARAAYLEGLERE